VLKRTLLVSSPFLLSIVSAAAPARADTTTPVASAHPGKTSVIDHPGFDFGLRLAYAVPFGDQVENTSLNDTFSGAIPLVLEAGYRFTRNISAGALFQYAFGQIKGSAAAGFCNDNGVSCSGSVMRVGIEGIYNLRLDTPLDPWVGLGIGYEWGSLSGSGNNFSFSGTDSGFEFLTLQGGGDYRLAPQFALGPFLSFSIARYGSQSVTMNGTTTSMDIGNTAVHEWLQIGVRGTFSL
jgi:hypothetical protein